MSGIPDDQIEKLLSAAFQSGTEARLLAPVSRAELLAEGSVDHVGSFRVLAVLGVGGTSWVYRVHDPGLDRPIALKVLHSAAAVDERMVRQFEREAVLCGRLDHPGVVPIHARGRLEDGRPYFTMRIIDGDDLAQVLQERDHAGVDSVGMLEIFLKICQVLAYAHEQGVVHLDLKPQNVRVGRFGEVQVVDWGFAHAIDDPDPPPRIGGTPAYMAPEQARRDGRRLGPRTDVFGLGGLLCEILTGVPPYDAEPREETLLAASQGWLEEAWNRIELCGADPVLRRLARTCLERDVEARPRDASVLVETVQRHLAAVQERARASELAAAETRGLLRQERRARYITLALSAVIVVSIAVSFLIYLGVERERMQRVLHVESSVRETLDHVRANRLALDGPDESSESVERLRAGVERLRTLLDAPELEGELRTSAASTVRTIDAEMDRLEHERRFREGSAALHPHAGSRREVERFDAAYQELFAPLGLRQNGEVFELPEVSPKTLRVCIAALDDWSSVLFLSRTERDGRWRALHALARDLDDDPWRRDVRTAVLDGAIARLTQRAREPATLERDPTSLDLLARWLSAFGESEEAVRLYRAAHVRWRGSPVIAHNLACELERLPDPPREEIHALYSMALALDPSDHVRIDLALNRYEAGRPERALEWLDEASPTTTERDRLGLVRGLVLERLGRDADAFVAYETAMAFGSAAAGNRLAERLTERGWLDRAERVLRALLERLPDDVDARYQLGTVCLTSSRLTEAREHLERALARRPAFPEALCNLGTTLIGLGDLEGGLEHLERGHALGKQRADWSYPSADWIRDLETEIRAVEHVERLFVLGQLPSDPASCWSLALPALHLGYSELSLRLFLRFLRAPTISEEVLHLGRGPATRAALACGLGWGRFASVPDGTARQRYRDLAREWLSEDLAWWVEHRPVEEARTQLHRVGNHPALAFLRVSPVFPWPFGVLDPAERAEWKAFEAQRRAWLSELE